MPIDVSAHVDDAAMEDLLRSLVALGEDIAKVVAKEAVQEGAKAGLKLAKQLVPVRDRIGALNYKGGLLKKSLGIKYKSYRGGLIRVAVVGTRSTFRTAVGKYKFGKKAGQEIFFNPVKYAHLVEYGTRHSAPKPFLRPASELALKVTKEALTTKINQAIAKAALDQTFT